MTSFQTNNIFWPAILLTKCIPYCTRRPADWCVYGVAHNCCCTTATLPTLLLLVLLLLLYLPAVCRQPESIFLIVQPALVVSCCINHGVGFVHSQCIFTGCEEPLQLLSIQPAPACVVVHTTAS